MFGAKIPDIDENAHATGTYVCAQCGHALFGARHQFNAGCGFPSFWLHLGTGVMQKELNTYGRHRTQLVCSNCGLHLGHLFPYKNTPTGMRYCINQHSIKFVSQ